MTEERFMKVTALIDNISDNDLISEWGLSFYIEYNDHKYLLDTGASDKFVNNAKKLGISLETVDYAVLSHAHYDHSDGFGAFFEINKKVKCLLREGIHPNCYSKSKIFKHYVGINKDILKNYSDRFRYIDGDFEVAPGVMLIPHKTKNLNLIGKKCGLYTKNKLRCIPDDFSHEQSLVFDAEKGLIIFNSCSHGGGENIVNEIRVTYPNKKIYAYIGGLHLYKRSDEDIKEIAEQIKKTGIEKVYTGHCTGNRAFGLLKEELADQIH